MTTRALDWVSGLSVAAWVVFGVALWAQGQEAAAAGEEPASEAILTKDDSLFAGVRLAEFCFADTYAASSPPHRSSPAHIKAPREIAINVDRNIELTFLGKNLLEREYDLRENPRAAGMEMTFRFGGTGTNPRRTALGERTKSHRYNTHTVSRPAPQLAYRLHRHLPCS